MKTIIILALILSASTAIASDAGPCYVISDGDQRQFCLAKARKDPGTCYAIQNASVRSQCLAEVLK